MLDVPHLTDFGLKVYVLAVSVLYKINIKAH